MKGRAVSKPPLLGLHLGKTNTGCCNFELEKEDSQNANWRKVIYGNFHLTNKEEPSKKTLNQHLETEIKKFEEKSITVHNNLIMIATELKNHVHNTYSQQPGHKI